MRKHNAFTLIELLVVISIITLLMAILLPTLQRLRNQAGAVACQAKLRQSGVLCSMYADENNGRLFGLGYSGYRRLHQWSSIRSNNVKIFVDESELILCPMATRWRLRPGNLCTAGRPSTSNPNVGVLQWIVGSKSTAWCHRRVASDPLKTERGELTGSYGLNYYVHEFSIDRYPSSYRNNIPVILDCIVIWGKPSPFDEPPTYEDSFNFKGSFASNILLDGDITSFSMDRHNGGVNSLFLDWSVRKVSLKELWAVKWSDEFDTAGPWTKAGGVLPSDWPQWMRNFKDY